MGLMPDKRQWVAIGAMVDIINPIIHMIPIDPIAFSPIPTGRANSNPRPPIAPARPANPLPARFCRFPKKTACKC